MELKAQKLDDRNRLGWKGKLHELNHLRTTQDVRTRNFIIFIIYGGTALHRLRNAIAWSFSDNVTARRGKQSFLPLRFVEPEEAVME
jgi:hypothetical protein